VSIAETITNLPYAIGLAGNEQLEIVQNGTSKRATVAQVAALNGGGGGPGFVTPEAGLAFEIITGGTAIVVASGPISGGYVINPNPVAAQGIGGDVPENGYLDMTEPPGSTDSTASGTTSILFPGDRFDLPALNGGVSVYVNAASSGHKLTVVIYP